MSKHKPMPTSTQIKKLNERIPLIHENKICECFKGTGKRDDRIAQKETKVNIDSFIINIEKYGNVNHTPENPVWKIPRFCYLEVINYRVHHHTFWPANSTVFTLAQFRPKYRQNISFTLIETKPGSHFRIRTFPDNGMDGTMSWKEVQFLATTDRSYMHVGGNDENSAFKPLDGTNYKQRAPKMRAYLMSKELWGYVSGLIPCPKAASIPKAPVPDTNTGMITTAQQEAYNKQLIAFNEANKKIIKWNVEDDKAVGSIQLRMVDKLSYLIKDNALETWNNIKSQFDVSGPTAIFVDFRYVINFKFDEKKDPSVQVAELIH